MAKKILLLGGTGFIGKNLAETINTNGCYELLSPTRAELNLLDADACHTYLRSIKPDYVVHSAVDINSTEASLQSFFNILNQKSHFGHLIQVGSGAEYDRKVLCPQVTEESFGKYIPTDRYGMTKYLISRELNDWGSGKVTNFRIFGIFGKYEDIKRRFISNNIFNVLSGRPISIDQDVVFDYIDVRDFCDFLLGILPRLPLECVSYNFCSGRPSSLSSIAEIIKYKMEVKENIFIKNIGFGREYTGSPRKLFLEVGNFEFRRIEETIDELISFYRRTITADQILLFKAGSNV